MQALLNYQNVLAFILLNILDNRVMSHIQHCFLAAEDFDETLSIYCALFSDFLSENRIEKLIPNGKNLGK